jgi:hypothetical protein
VPTIALTVSFALDTAPVVAVAGAQATVVPDVHAVVAQSAVPTASAVGVKLYAPKLSPEIVTDPPPELGALSGIPPLTAGASNVKLFDALVPTTALTVTFVNEAVSVIGALTMHSVLVFDVHEVVPQTASTTAMAVGVKPYEPKLKPRIVADEPPDVATFNEP